MAVGADATATMTHIVVHYFFSSAVFWGLLAVVAEGSPLSNCKANSVNFSEMRISDFETVESCCVNRLMGIDPPLNKGLSRSKVYIVQSLFNGTIGFMIIYFFQDPNYLKSYSAACIRFWRDIQAFLDVKCPTCSTV